MKLNQLVLCSLLGFAATQALACYTVYDNADRVVYQSPNPPVDMSRPLHETLPARFPGAAHMIFDASRDCQVISSVATGKGGPTLSSTSPLLTDEKTARAMGLPHTVLPSGVALVQQKDAAIGPGVTVLPSTRVMGAGPARGGAITELRDAPSSMQSGARRNERSR